MTVVSAICLRTWRRVLRRPVTLAFSLGQPLFWMAFFGFLMQRFPLGELPADVSYVSFLLPGICALTVMQGSSQTGVGLIRDLQTGFLQRILATPAPRGWIHVGRLVAEGTRMHIQAGVVALLGLILGAEMQVAIGPMLVAIAMSVAFGFAFSSLSTVVALRARAPEPMGTFVQLVNMPLLFTSTALVPAKQMPAWLAAVSAYNPLSMVADGLRDALIFGDTPLGLHVAILMMLALVMGGLAVREMERLGANPEGPR